ncbi:MAG: hypothetical protein BGO99_05210 [Nitrosospira sp. 56-18]|nr:MAG: hypothetical protein BGO99_05210 [Nitrosospira sp. 56-18]
MPKKCLVDTNVPKTANLVMRADSELDVPYACVLACIEAVEHVIKKRCLIIDAGDEIFSEYRRQLSMEGQPGVGDRFMKWVHDNRFSFTDSDRVTITRNGESYEEFPIHEGLANFDKSDCKFVAVSNAHIDKPPILQATDSKWWGWKDSLAEVGITVHFLCPDYAEAKCAEKMGT